MSDSQKIKLLSKLKRQGQLIRLCSWSLFGLVLLTWLIFGIWALIKKNKNKVGISKVFVRLWIFTLLISLVAGIVFASLWSVWRTGAELAEGV